MEKMNKCKFCGADITIGSSATPEIDGIDCPRCGFYGMSKSALACSLTLAMEELLLFSGYLRNNSSRSNPILLFADRLKKEEIEITIAPLKRLSILDKIDGITRFIGRNSKSLDERVPINVFNDYTKFYCFSLEELVAMLNNLKSRNLIDLAKLSDPYTKGVCLTVDGWQKYDQLREININSKKVFIAMSFDPQLKPIEHAVVTACGECNFKAFRVDSKEHTEKICDKIIADIKESRFIVADFTQNKHGVYFETGFALGLGLPVIWTCKDEEEEKKQLHFDTRQYNHIFWKDVEDLKKQLIDKIKVVIK